MRVRAAVLAVSCLYGLNVSPGMAQTARQQKAGESDVVVKVYNVTDLVLPTPSYPMKSARLPTLGFGDGPSDGLGMMGGLGGGGMMGFPQSAAQGGSGMSAPGLAGLRRGAAFTQVQFGGGGSGGGGLGTGGFGGSGMMGFGSEPKTSNLRFGLGDLQDVLIATVAPETWDTVGGPGTCQQLGTMLIVGQTKAVHSGIEDFLDQVRKSGGTLKTVSIDAYWIQLDADGVAKLTGNPVKGVRVVDHVALAALPNEAKSCQGRITCFDGQTVHIVSGRSQTVVTGVTAVVGDGGPAYDPSIANGIAGAMLQITPAISADGKAAMLDLRSVVSRWQDRQKPLTLNDKIPNGSVDRVSVVAQEFATSLRIPLESPVLVGGMTLDPDQDDSGLQVVLVLQVAAE